MQHSEADDAVIVNNGLHSLHLNDTEEYRELYYKFIAFLLKEFSDAPIFIALTTSVRNTERECYEMLAKKIPECLKSI